MSTPTRDIYLAEDFEASSLKVPQLRSILIEHGIHFRSTSKKADLVELFTTQLKPRAAQILAADAAVRPSARGIVAVSSAGNEASVDSPSTTSGVKRPRGRPRKTAPEQLEEMPSIVVPDAIPSPEPVEAPPLKKPRSRRQTSEPVPAVTETPAKKRGRPRKTKPDELPAEVELSSVPEAVPAPAPASAVATPSRRKSVKPPAPVAPPPLPAVPMPALAPAPAAVAPPTAGPSSLAVPHADTPRTGRKPRSSINPVPDEPVTPKEQRKPRISHVDPASFSDFNPFQSGSEEAAERERRRRKSSLGLGEGKRRAPRPSEWTATSAPSAGGPVPSVPTPPSILRRVGPSNENLRSPPDDVRQALRDHIEFAENHNRVVEEKFGQLQPKPEVASAAPETSVAEPQPPADDSIVVGTKVSKAIVRRRRGPPAPAAPVMPLALLGLLLLALAGQYKSLSAMNGYCDTESTTNSVIQGREAPIQAAQQCIARRSQFHLDHPDETAPFECDLGALPLVPFLPRPTACAPCPANALCEDGEVKACMPEYILTQNVLAPLSPLVEGWPGIGPRPFPASCRPDTERMRQIGVFARSIERELAQGRGAIVCAGLDATDKPEGQLYGTPEETLRNSFAERRSAKISREDFDEIFDAAVRDLVKHGDVIESIDKDGVSWYASARTDMTVSCRAKMEVTSVLERWKSQLAFIAAIMFLTRSLDERKKERARARMLADTVLRRLQDQEYQHYIDPVQTPASYLPPAQLRDVVLPASEGEAVRQRLWSRVEAEVEKNANVAVREREVRGDVWKTWEWTGVARLEQ